MNPDSCCGEQGVPGTLSCLQCDSLSTENVLGKAGLKHLGVLYLTLLKLHYFEINVGGKIWSTSCITPWQCSLWVGWLKAGQKCCFKVLSLFTPHSPSPAPSGALVFPEVERWGAVPLHAAAASPLQNQQCPLCPTCGFVPGLGQPRREGTRSLPCARPWESQQNNPGPEGSPCSLNRNCLLTPDWECSECPETQFLQHGEQNAERNISIRRQR